MTILYDFIPSKQVRDTISNDADKVTSFAKSFKNYDTCMANTGCKIVFIVGCVLLGLLVIWVISTIVQCLCMGVKCIEACCCCCCRSQSNTAYQQPPQTYINPNMYPDAQYNQRYAYQPQPPMSAYPGPSNDSVKSEYGYNNHDGYEPVGNNNTNYQSPFNDRYKY